MSDLPSDPTADGFEPCTVCGRDTRTPWRHDRTMKDGLGGHIQIPSIVHAACYHAQPPHRSTRDRWPWKR